MRSDQFLPATGRGTIRRMVEGLMPQLATSAGQDMRLVPHHQLRWSPSPYRGGIYAR